MSRGKALAAAAIGIGVVIGYLVTIANQGADFAPRVVFLATFIATMSALSLAGAFVATRDGVNGQTCLVAAATGMLEAGALALASIGIFLVLAGLLAFVAAGTRRLSWSATIAISSVVSVAFLGGIALT